MKRVGIFEAKTRLSSLVAEIMAEGEVFQITKHGLQPPLAPFGYKSDMPAFMETLSDEQIWAVLAYIKSLWPAPTQARQDRMNEADY